MKFNNKAKLDTSEVQDQRGSGGGGGGGGLGGLGGMFGGGGGGGGTSGGGGGLPGGLGNLGGLAKGGGGLGILVVIGVIAFMLFSGGGSGSTGTGNILNNMLGGGANTASTADNTQLAANCKTGEDANNNSDCALVAVVNSVQDYWTAEMAKSGTTYSKSPPRNRCSPSR